MAPVANDSSGGVPWQNLWVFSATDTVMTAALENFSGTLASDVQIQVVWPQPVTHYSYDPSGHLVQEIAPDGTVQSWTYPSTPISTAGGPLYVPLTYAETDSDAAQPVQQTLYTYDGCGNLHSTEQLVGSQPNSANDLFTYYSYTDSTGHPAGLVATMTDPDGNETAYSYDSAGDLLSETAAYGTPDAATTQYQYNAAGDQTTVIDPLGNETNYTVHNLDRVPSATGPEVAAGQPVTQYTYDALGNVLEKRVAQSESENSTVWETTSYTYNYLGEPLTMTQPAPNDDSGTVTTYYTYTPTGELLTETDPLVGVTTYHYDALGRETWVSQPNPATGDAGGPTTYYTYDALGELTLTTDPMGNVTTYDYQDFGRQVTTTLPSPETNHPGPEYTDRYSADGQVTSDAGPGDNSGGYWDVTSHTYNALGEPEQVALNGKTLGPAYDKDGNMMSSTDVLGNETTYSYNALNELTEKQARPRSRTA